MSVEYKEWQLDISCTYEQRRDIGVVCLHGLQSNKNAFESVQALCKEKRLSFLALDFVGFGRSSKPKNFTYALEDQAAIVSEVIRGFQLEKFFLVGHSMGGVVGTLLLKEWEKELLGFLNLEGNFTVADSSLTVQVSDLTAEAFERHFYLAHIASLKKVKAPNGAKRLEALLFIPQYAFYKSCVSINAWAESGKLLPLYLESPVPKVFLCGEENRGKRDLLPPEVIMKEVPGVGHFMLADNPDGTKAAMEEFMAEVIAS